jgi:SAM-dependent methyltransferase
VLPGFFAFTALVTLGGDRLRQVSFPDVSLHLWGSENQMAIAVAALSLALVLLMLAMVVGCFLLQGVAVGYFFRQLPTLRAYSFDLGGGFLGILSFALVTASGAPPWVWFLVGGLPFLIIDRRARSAAALVGTAAVGWFSAGGSLYSPYNRIDLQRIENGDIELRVNHDFHQHMRDFSTERIARSPEPERTQRDFARVVYDLPYTLAPRHGRALIVGAGSGNDARAALRNGFDSIYAVDIDPMILDIGGVLHPERPYDDGRVVQVVNDARAFLQGHRGPPFDLISYGFLDSHSMFSAMSSLRLENYVYSEEGLRAAWDQLADDGVLSVAFSVLAGPWIQDRLYWTLAKATGREPLLVQHRLYAGSTFVVSRDAAAEFRIAPFQPARPSTTMNQVRTTSDDWPFLYLRPGSVPWAYLLILSCVLIGSFLLVRWVFGPSLTGASFDAPLFFFGAAFLLLETRAVTSLSLLFGATWFINAAVFGGILLTALLANLYVQRMRPRSEAPWFVLLFVALALLWLVTPGQLAGLTPIPRALMAGLLAGLPVGFAGVIVSSRLGQMNDPTGALGSNLLGAVLGGCLEYSSMLIGLRGLLGLAALLYALGLFVTRRTGRYAGAV